MARSGADPSSGGLSIRTLHFLMALAMLLLSAILVVATFMVKSGYSRMRVNTEHYIRWEQDAGDLQLASGHLWP